MGFRSSVSPVQTHGRGCPLQIRAVGVGAYTVLSEVKPSRKIIELNAQQPIKYFSSSKATSSYSQSYTAMCRRAHSGEVRGRIRHCKSGTNYTPAASSSLREFRIGSCEKPSATQTPQPKLFQKDLVVIPPRVEQMGELTNQRSFFFFCFATVSTFKIQISIRIQY